MAGSHVQASRVGRRDSAFGPAKLSGSAERSVRPLIYQEASEFSIDAIFVLPVGLVGPRPQLRHDAAGVHRESPRQAPWRHIGM
jgi:hypothetical protein